MYEVNRSVFIVIPNEPFWYWLNSLPDSDLSGITLEDLQDDANSYLVDACENADALWEEIENRVEEIFAAELGVGAKTKVCGPICTPIFSANGLTSSYPAS